MKPYRRRHKLFSIQMRNASWRERVWVLVKQFAGDVHCLWRYGSPFPTILKLFASLLLFIVVVMPLIYPFVILAISYFTFESLYLSWRYDNPSLFLPKNILHRITELIFQPCPFRQIWKVREVLIRGILLTHSLATSVDYLCVIQGLIDDV